MIKILDEINQLYENIGINLPRNIIFWTTDASKSIKIISIIHDDSNTYKKSKSQNGSSIA